MMQGVTPGMNSDLNFDKENVDENGGGYADAELIDAKDRLEE